MDSCKKIVVAPTRLLYIFIHKLSYTYIAFNLYLLNVLKVVLQIVSEFYIIVCDFKALLNKYIFLQVNDFSFIFFTTHTILELKIHPAKSVS